MLLALFAASAFLPALAREKTTEALERSASNRPEDLREAAELAAYASKLDPFAVDPLFAAAGIADRRGQTRLAIQYLTEAVERQPDNARAWVRLGRRQILLDDLAAANQSSEFAVSLDPQGVGSFFVALGSSFDERRSASATGTPLPLEVKAPPAAGPGARHPRAAGRAAAARPGRTSPGPGADAGTRARSPSPNRRPRRASRSASTASGPPLAQRRERALEPVGTSTVLSQPSSAFAREQSSAMWRTSPGRSGACSGSKPSCACGAQRLDQVEHAGLPAGADVERAARLRLRGLQVGLHDVADVHVVARLEAVAEHRRAPALEQLAAEDRDHAGLAERVLARAVDVAVAQRDGRDAVQAAEQLAVALGRELRLPVGGLGRDRVVLGRREDAPLAVDRRRPSRCSPRARPRPGARPRAR